MGHTPLSAPIDPLGGGGNNGGMDARLAKLEAIIPTLATKEDVVKLRGETKEGFADVRAEMHRNASDIIKWVVGTAGVIAVGAVTIMTFVLNNAAPKAPIAQAQPPIIINVPAPAPAQKP